MFVRSRAGAGSLLLPLLASLTLFAAACNKTDGDVCVSDRTCGTGRRCEEVKKGDPKICVACDPTELPYDGIDNDCNSRTPDSDLDGDGENSKDAPVRPGNDCDDTDPTVSSVAREVCDDGKDNNCDGRIDEPECADRLPPTVSIVRPRNGDLVAGRIEVEVQASDDVRVAQVKLSVNGNVLGTSNDMATIFTVDTTVFPDEPLTLTVEAFDLADRTASTDVTVNLDNHTAPLVTVVSPLDGAAYAGLLTLEATALDASGIAGISFAIDGEAPVTSTAAPYRRVVDTSPLAEGAHEAIIEAADTNGNVASKRVAFVVDRTGPDLHIEVSPIVGTAVSGTFTVDITATDGASVLGIDATAGGHVYSATSSPLSFSVASMGPPRLPNGPFVISAVSRDATIVDGVLGEGNLRTLTATVVVDNTPPEPIVELVNPQDGWGVFRATNLTANVTSPVGNTIDSVEFFVDGVSVYLDTSSPWGTTFDFTGMVGTATVTVVATDSQDYQTTAVAGVRIVPPPHFRTADVAAMPSAVGNASYAIGDVTGDGIPDAVLAGTDTFVLTGTITDGRFRFLRPVAIGGTSRAVRLANVDVDPALDVIALTNSTIEVYTNQGFGTFNPSVSSPIGGVTPTDMELGDLDGDGQVDVVLGLSAGGDIRVFLQHNGVFGAGRSYGTVGTVTDVALADVDQDGDLDVVLSRGGSTVASVYRNLPGGTFGSAQDSFTSEPTQAVAVGDLTGDGYPDLAVVAQGIDAIEVLVGNPATPGSFTLQANPVHTQNNPSGLTLADLDRDGALDAVVSCSTSNAVDILRNVSGTLTATRSYNLGRDLAQPAVVDLDGDGREEIVASTPTENGLVWATSLGQMRFIAPEEIFSFYAMTAVAAGDLIGDDGLLDLAVTSPPPVGVPGSRSLVTILHNTGAGFVVNQVLALTGSLLGPTSIAVGDLDGQNGLDIAVGSSNSPTSVAQDTAALLLSSGPGTFRQPVALGIDRPLSVAIGDVNNDGVGEAVFSQDVTPVGTHDGSLVFSASAPLSPLFDIPAGFGASSIAIANLDDDPLGLLDYAVANSNTNDITVNLWNGTGFNTVTFNALPGINGITVGRVGEDDINDIVGVSSSSGVIVMEGLPGFGFAGPVQWNAGPSPSGVVGGDFNGDGLYDVMVMNPSSDTVSLLVASPQGGFFPPVTIPTVENPSGFVVGDFDRDGRDDIAVVSGASGTVVVIYNNKD